jgi:hypothetical protein
MVGEKALYSVQRMKSRGSDGDFGVYQYTTLQAAGKRRFGEESSLQRLKGLRENSHCVVPSGLDLREILPGTPVPGYRLSRPFGTDSVG